MELSTGLLLSGNLGFVCLKKLEKETTIQFVLTNKTSNEIIDYCHNKNIPLFTGNPRKLKTKVKEFLTDKPVDYLFSINYLYIIEKDILKHPKYHAINFHGSLLPKYRGRTPHVWAIINGEKKTGITAHLMEEGYDTGAIVKQVHINIDTYDTGSDLLKKFEKKYPLLIDELISSIDNNKLHYEEQDNLKATYFGKRKPEDGEINWNWQKERIRNWVRAQAYPYPGAFSYYNEQKIIIDEIQFSDLGYDYLTPNGTILKTKPYPFVKTPNGVVVLSNIRNGKEISFKENTKFEMEYEN